MSSALPGRGTWSETNLFSPPFLSYAHADDVDHVLDDDTNVLKVSSTESFELLVGFGFCLLEVRQTLDPASATAKSQAMSCCSTTSSPSGP